MHASFQRKWTLLPTAVDRRCCLHSSADQGVYSRKNAAVSPRLNPRGGDGNRPACSNHRSSIQFGRLRKYRRTSSDGLPGLTLSDQASFLCHRPLSEKRSIVLAHTCKRCGAIGESPVHLGCACADQEKCSFCGTAEVDVQHVCKDKLAEMEYACTGCGRVAMAEVHLCRE